MRRVGIAVRLTRVTILALAPGPDAGQLAPVFFVAGLTLAASFLCSLLEAALYTITPSQIALLRQNGAASAQRLQRLRENVEEPIAAILTINTIAHTIGSAWCGAMVAKAYGGDAAVGIFAAVFTLLVLVLTEIIPKSIGVRYARELGTFIVWPLQVMIWIALPIARPAHSAMRWLTGGKGPVGPSEAEVVLFSKLAHERGEMRLEEHKWLENALLLDSLMAQDIRTPRTVVETFGAETRLGDLEPDGWKHSRAPIVEGGESDRVVGLAYRREVFDAVLAGQTERTLAELMHPIRFVPETLPAHKLLDLFLRERVHLVALSDEFGGFDGVVTLEDVLERLLGSEIVDEHDEFEDMQEVARQLNPHAGVPSQGSSDETGS